MSGKSVILEEDTDPNYVPTREEIVDYALFLGMELPRDENLLWIATEGLKAPLPPKWKPCKSQDGEVYYFNFSTGESTWEHPCDQFYKNIYKTEYEKSVAVAASASEGSVLAPSLARKSSGPLQTVLKDKIVLSKIIPKLERKNEEVCKPVAVDNLKNTAEVDKLDLVWREGQKQEMALERQEWQKKRQTEAESWMKAKQAEIDAEKHRRYNEVRAQMEKGIETIMEESNLRLEEQREILRKEQAQHDQAMEDRRIEWMTVLKEESRKREATMKSRMEELESMHNLEIKRRQAEHEEEMKAIDRDAALQVTIREDAIKARIAELELAAQQVEREAIENENDRKRIWKERSERIEQEGKEKCRKEEDAWNIKRKSEQVRVDSELIQTNALLESELDNQRKAMAALKTACDTECQIMSNKLKKLESELISVKQENSKLIQSKPDMSDIEYRESLKQQDELLQRKYQTALDQMKAERDNALARIANHTCTKRDGEADNSLSDDEDEMEDVASSGLSDISDFSEADWNGYHSWNRQLNREQASITQAGRYLKQQRRSMSRARVALIKDQARWKKDSDASQDNPTGTDKHILVRELKRRKKFLDQRAHRLNSDISQYRRLKRGVSKRQDGLRDMIRESVNIPIKPGPDSNMDHQADKANTESKPSTTANTITNSVAKDTRAALNAHYGWLTSFRSEMQRSQEPGKAPGRYQLGRSPTNRTQPSLITPSNNNDITIRIKVEK